MPAYDFECMKCEHWQEVSLMWSQYEKILVEVPSEWGYIESDDYLCEECGHNQLKRIVIKAPRTEGHEGQFLSVEKYWEKRPAERRRKEEQLLKEEAKRIEKVKAKVDKQSTRDEGRHRRHKDYGKDQRENKLRLN